MQKNRFYIVLSCSTGMILNACTQAVPGFFGSGSISLNQIDMTQDPGNISDDGSNGIDPNDPTMNPNPNPSATPSPRPSPSATPSPTPSATPSPTPSATPSPTPSATPSPTPSATPSPTPSATPSPSPTPTWACQDDEVELWAAFRCHSSAESGADNVHCNVRYQISGDRPGGTHLSVNYNVAPAGTAGCLNAQANSVLAKIAALPDQNGNYHFAGRIKACVNQVYFDDTSKNSRVLNSLLLSNFMLALTEEGGKRVGAAFASVQGFGRITRYSVTTNSSVNDRKTIYDLSQVTGPAPNRSYCKRSGN